MYKYQTPEVIEGMAEDIAYCGHCFCEVIDTPFEFSIKRLNPFRMELNRRGCSYYV